MYIHIYLYARTYELLANKYINFPIYILYICVCMCAYTYEIAKRLCETKYFFKEKVKNYTYIHIVKLGVLEKSP